MRVLTDQLQFSEKGSEPGVAFDFPELGIAHYLTHTPIAEPVRSIQPFKGTVGLSPIRVHFRNLEWTQVPVFCDEFRERLIRLLSSAGREIHQRHSV